MSPVLCESEPDPNDDGQPAEHFTDRPNRSLHSPRKTNDERLAQIGRDVGLASGRRSIMLGAAQRFRQFQPLRLVDKIQLTHHAVEEVRGEAVSSLRIDPRTER